MNCPDCNKPMILKPLQLTEVLQRLIDAGYFKLNESPQKKLAYARLVCAGYEYYECTDMTYCRAFKFTKSRSKLDALKELQKQGFK